MLGEFGLGGRWRLVPLGRTGTRARTRGGGRRGRKRFVATAAITMAARSMQGLATESRRRGRHHPRHTHTSALI